VSTENFPHDTGPVPGAIALVDDEFRARLNAHSSDGDLPLIWTPEHVTTRLVAAYDALHRMRQVVGPSTRSGFWPEVLLDDMQLRDQDRKAEKVRAQSRARALPTSHEIELMDEALAWPLRFLQDSAKQADALTLYCACKATEREIEPILKVRRHKAVTSARTMTEARERQDAAGTARRRAIARMIASDANERLATARSDKEAASIRKAAADLFKKRCLEDGCAAPVIRPHEAMPDAVLNWPGLEKHRKAAAIVVAKALRGAGTAVR
jgi:hypothetical protein